VGHTIHSITSHGTLNALTDLSAHVIDVQREKEGGQRFSLSKVFICRCYKSGATITILTNNTTSYIRSLAVARFD